MTTFDVVEFRFLLTLELLLQKCIKALAPAPYRPYSIVPSRPVSTVYPSWMPASTASALESRDRVQMVLGFAVIPLLAAWTVLLVIVTSNILAV